MITLTPFPWNLERVQFNPFPPSKETLIIIPNRHYLCISKHAKCINLCIWCKTKALGIHTGNNTSNKSPMSKIVIQCILIGPICTLLQSSSTLNSSTINQPLLPTSYRANKHYLDITEVRVISSNASIKYGHLDLCTSVAPCPQFFRPKHGSNL